MSSFRIFLDFDWRHFKRVKAVLMKSWRFICILFFIVRIDRVVLLNPLSVPFSSQSEAINLTKRIPCNSDQLKVYLIYNAKPPVQEYSGFKCSLIIVFH